MYLHKSKRSPFYQLIYFVDGKRTSASTKKTTKAEATKFLINFQIPSKLEKTNYNITLSTFESEYLKHLEKSKSNSYIKSVKLSFRQLNYFSENVQLSLLSSRILEEFITDCYMRSKSASALYYRTLKAAFNKAVDWEYLKTNPFLKIKAPKIPKKIPMFFTESDIQKILVGTTDILIRQFIIFAFNTGMRAGEIVNLQWEAINMSERLIYVRNSATFTTKSGKERIIPMNENVWQIILQLFQEKRSSSNEGYVFLRKGYIQLKEDFISKKFKKILRELNFHEDFHLHSLRHSFASNLVQKGVSLYVVKELLGHSSITVTQVYSHLDSSNLESAVKLINFI